MQATDIQAAALNVIGQARMMAPTDTGPTEQLTDAEERALGRYFEKPELEEVYPGLRGTVPGSRR